MRLFYYLVFSLFLCSRVYAEISWPDIKRIYASTHFPNTLRAETLRYAQINLQGGSELKISSPERWAPLVDRATASSTKVHQDFEEYLGSIPPVATSIRLIENSQFFRLTGAPKWTNAVYYRGEIMIPIESSNEINLKKFDLTVRHEFSHAIINALSGGRCPGWLDEGLAQWAEGSHNPVFRMSLRRWLLENQPLALGGLQKGFTELDYELASAAYAQSLFAAHQVIYTFGFKSLRVFFDGLRQGLEQGVAFERAFLMSEKVFERKLKRALHDAKVGTLYPLVGSR